MCKLTYLLKFICVPKSIPTVSLQSFADLCTCGTVKTLSLQEHTFAAEAEQGDALFSCFSSHIVTKCPFCGQINAQIKYHIFCPPPRFFFAFCWQFCCLKWFSSVELKRCLVFLSAKKL